MNNSKVNKGQETCLFLFFTLNLATTVEWKPTKTNCLLDRSVFHAWNSAGALVTSNFPRNALVHSNTFPTDAKVGLHLLEDLLFGVQLFVSCA